MAQNIILCQFCEISFEITWKCFNCDLVLCNRCIKNHSKFGGSEDHCIIDLNQIGTPGNVEIIRKFNLRNIQCTTHKEERCPLFCKDCNKPVCSFCVIESGHKGHNIDKLITVYNNQLSDLKDIKERIEKNYSDLKISVRESTSTSDNYKEIKEKIIQREKEIKGKVSEQAAFLIDELDKLIIPSKEVFMEEKQKIQERESMVKETNKLIDEALQSNQATYVLKTIGKVDKHIQLNVNADNIPLDQKFMFTVPNSLSINFGSVKVCPNNLRVINTFETNVPCIQKLKSLKNGTLVFFYEKGGDQFIEYCDIQGDQCIVKFKTCILPSIWKGKGKVHNMTVTEDNVILFTTDTWGSNSNKILCMNAYDEQLKKIEFCKNSTLTYKTFNLNSGIHSFDQTILIGFHRYNCSYSKDKLDMGVMILDKEGNCSETLWITDNDSECKKISSIESLTTNTNGDILICDQHNLSAFDSKLKFKWTNQNLTSPNDIVTTPNELIAVTDKNSIHLFSMEGKHLKSIGEQEGIYHPSCLHINKSGQLLVGCEGQPISRKSKIHVVEIFA